MTSAPDAPLATSARGDRRGAGTRDVRERETVTNIYCIRPKGFNVGNEAIHVALREQLGDRRSASRSTSSTCRRPPATVACEGGLHGATVHEINQYGDGVIVGGGNLYENGGLDVDRHALRPLGVPMMLYSLSMGRIYDRRGELSGARIRCPTRPDDPSRSREHLARTRRGDRRHLADAGAAAELGGCPMIGIDRVHPAPRAGRRGRRCRADPDPGPRAR